MDSVLFNFVAFKQIQVAEDMHTCKKCQNKFSDNEAMENHMLSHNDVVDILSCNHCDQKFTDKATLKIHMYFHNNIVNIFSCNQYDQTFIDDATLEMHMMLYSDKHNKYSSNTDSGVVCEEEEEEKEGEEKEKECRGSRFENPQDIKSIIDLEILSVQKSGDDSWGSCLAKLDQEEEQLMYLEEGEGEGRNIFTSTPVYKEELSLQSLEDLLEADSTLSRALSRSRRGRVRRWLGRLGGRLLEGVAVLLAAVL